MRHQKGGIGHLSGNIEEDLKSRDTGLYVPHVKGLTDLATSALISRSVNSSEWIAVMPRTKCDLKSIERYISRFLSNRLIDPVRVMDGFIPGLLNRSGGSNCTVILMLDQSKICDGFECLMISMRVGDRAIPLLWRVIETKGPIGFEIQKELLDAFADKVPEGASILLAADRFYGTSALVDWCKTHSWHYRIRLKGNLIFQQEGGQISTGDAVKMGVKALTYAHFYNTSISTNIGILHEPKHPEPWIIAMDCEPTQYTVLDYGLRWGIESLFSDLKSRGFGISKTKLTHADRIERLILILTIATYWAVSTGMDTDRHPSRYTKKNTSAP